MVDPAASQIHAAPPNTPPQDLPLSYVYAYVVGGDGGTEVALLTKTYLTSAADVILPQVSVSPSVNSLERRC